MATDETDARNIPPIKTLICHPDREFKYAVCILCDGAYCKSDFDRVAQKKKGFYITNTLVVCGKHNLTYKSSHETDIDGENFDLNKVLKLKLNVLQVLSQEKQNPQNNKQTIDESNIEINRNNNVCMYVFSLLFYTLQMLQ